MKKILCIITLLFITFSCFSSEFEDLLKDAIQYYNSGDAETALQNIEAAKKIIDAEKIQNTNNDYSEVSKWDIVNLKKDLFLEKKVKCTTTFSGISGSNYIILSDIGACKFSERLVDKILSLEKMKKYTFYGTVKESFAGTTLFVEEIE